MNNIDKLKAETQDKIDEHDRVMINSKMNDDHSELLAIFNKLAGRKEGIKLAKRAIGKDVDELNENFRKENMPQRLSGDEFNDLWEEKIKQILWGEVQKDEMESYRQ